MQSISKFMASLIAMGFGLLESLFVGRITNPVIKRTVQLPLTRIRQTVNALADADPNNDAQVNKIWHDFVSDDVPDFAESEITEAIKKVENKDVRLILEVFAPRSVAILRAVTDDNPDNKEQITAIGKEILEDKEAKEVAVRLLIAWVEKNIKNEQLRLSLIEMLSNLDLFAKEANAMEP